MNETTVKMRRRCRTCSGKGLIEEPHCQLCHRRIAVDDTWRFSDDEITPCGHPEEHLSEAMICSECGGAGWSEQWLSPVELRAIRRGKIARIAFIAGASLALLISLVIVIWNTSPVEPVCGYWWYLIPPFFILVPGRVQFAHLRKGRDQYRSHRPFRFSVPRFCPRWAGRDSAR